MRPAGELVPVDYLVIWQPASADPTLPWWWRYLVRRLLKPGFGHVLIIMLDAAAGVWTVVDPLFGGLRIANVPLSVTCGELLADYPGTTYALLNRRRDTFPKRVRWGLTCVAAVAAILALDRTPLTPWRLYRHIARLAEDEGS